MTFEEKIKQYYPPKEYSVGLLTSAEEEFINKEYSASVEDVKLISKSQAWVLDNQGIISPNFCIQILFKIRGLIDINKIKNNINGLVKNNELLRSAFILKQQERALQIILQDRSPEMTFIDFTKDKLTEFEIDEIVENTLAADRRRFFDLKKDRLLRIRVVRFGYADYAITIQQPQIIADGWDVRHLFDGIFSEQETDDVLAKMIAPKRYSFAQHLERRKDIDISKTLEYWQKKLYNFTETKLPGHKVSNTYVMNSLLFEFDDKMFSYMKKHLENNTNAIVLLQTAWGIMLQKYNKVNDAVFPLLLSNYRDGKEDNLDFVNIINLVPVRINESETAKVSDVVKRQQANLILARAYSGCNIRELENLFSGKTLFNHMLNFHSFYKQEKYTQAEVALGVNVVKLSSYDCYNLDLVVVFRLTKKIQIEFIYNREAFSEVHIKKIKEDYFYIINQILKDQGQPLGEINLPQDVLNPVKHEENLKLNITQLLRSKEIFRALSDVELGLLIRGIVVKNYIYGDIILAEGEKQEYLYLIYDGAVELRRTIESGWTIKIATIEKGEFISYDGIFDNKESSLRARVVSQEVTIIAVRNETATEIIKNNYDFAKAVIQSITAQVDKFQQLWVDNKN